jgi:hypothetical protein
MLNITSDLFLEGLQARALEEGVLDMLDQYLSHHHSDRALCNMVLLTVSSFADSGTGTGTSYDIHCTFYQYMY